MSTKKHYRKKPKSLSDEEVIEDQKGVEKGKDLEDVRYLIRLYLLFLIAFNYVIHFLNILF